ncbi:MAG: nickel-type superoxide dismutase maturation protease [Chloroflexi bacterium]|nr:nickel-type superoxide dismutase maturation protease [Chloroflexota bacterium]
MLPRWQRRRVNGRSMQPTLAEGTTLLLDMGAYCHQLPQIGDIVLAQHPFQPGNKMLKRITAVSDNGRYFLRGDNPNFQDSTDSRSFGAVNQTLILAKVTHRF